MASMKYLWLSLCFLGHALPCMGMSAQQLVSQLDAGEVLTLVDVRPAALYTHGHIPGAISIPATLVSVKHLPPMGKVVVYGDGLDTQSVEQAAQSLKSHSSAAEVLDGGILAWEELKGSTQTKSGMGPEMPPFASYSRVAQALETNPDCVWVDLRAPASGLTNLRQGRYARAAYIGAGSPKNVSLESATTKGAQSVMRQWKPGGKKLYILVDDGNGRAEAVARRLRAGGVRRVRMLTGGELSLKTEGRSETVTVQQGGQ